MRIPAVDKLEERLYYAVNEAAENAIEMTKKSKEPSSNSSNSNSYTSFISRFGGYAAIPIALYGMYKKYNTVSSFLEPDNSNSAPSSRQGGLESRLSSGQTQQQEESFMRSPTAQTALYGLKIMVGTYLALGGYQRLRAAREYYEGEVDVTDITHGEGMTIKHLCGLAYALTYGEAPPSNVESIKKTGAFKAVYNTLKTLRVDRLDNTQLGSWAIMSLLSMGEQVGEKMGEEAGGGLFKKAKKTKVAKPKAPANSNSPPLRAVD